MGQLPLALLVVIFTGFVVTHEQDGDQFAHVLYHVDVLVKLIQKQTILLQSYVELLQSRTYYEFQPFWVGAEMHNTEMHNAHNARGQNA